MRVKPIFISKQQLACLLLVINLVLFGTNLSACGTSQTTVPTEPQVTPSMILSATITESMPQSELGNTTRPSLTPIRSQVTLGPTATTKQEEPEITATPRTPLPPDAWKDLPVIPIVSDAARQIYQHGLSLGRDPHSFSKIGDCQSITTYFLAQFDQPGLYNLGDYTSLQATIDWFSGSFERESMAVKGGLNAAAILSPLRADPKMCQAGESPVMCELRLNNPSLVIISLEEWWADDPTKYEQYMRQIIDLAITHGVLPILTTKADNLEGNHLINQTIAELAWEYEIPLWNFWLAVQPLPNHGLVSHSDDGKPDMFHLTHSENHYNFSETKYLTSGWAMRNLTALQALDAVWRGLNEHATP